MIKKLIAATSLAAIFITCFFIGFVPNKNLTRASAEEAYLRVLGENVFFYSSPDEETAVFILPYSYYVKKIGASGEYYHVECFGQGNTPMLDGFVKIEDVTPSDGTSLPYLSYSITTAKDAELYFERPLSDSYRYVFKNRTLYYYGKMTAASGEIFYCVSYNKTLGFIAEEDVYPFTVPLNPDPIDSPEPVSDTDDNKTGNKNTKTALKTAVAASLVLAAIIIIALIVLPEKKNDYESRE